MQGAPPGPRHRGFQEDRLAAQAIAMRNIFDRRTSRGDQRSLDQQKQGPQIYLTVIEGLEAWPGIEPGCKDLQSSA